jgi:hypothetical protein
MKKITGILLINIYPVLAVAQDKYPQEQDGFFHQVLVRDGEWLTWLALLLSIIAMVLHFRSRKPPKSKAAAIPTTIITDLQYDIGRLRSDLNNRLVHSDLSGLAEKIKLVEEKVMQMGQLTREKEWTNFKKKNIEEEAGQVSKNQTPVRESTQTDRQIVYAKLADLDDGFSSGIISLTQNGEQVYEIQTEGDTGVYRISSDPNAQKYALAESTFTLGKACELLNQPFKGCQIVLQKEGSLLNISGNWIIQQKAKIEFK